MLYLLGSKEVKGLLIQALSKTNLSKKTAVDFPAGSGFTSNYLLDHGAKVTAWDMFPEFFKSKKIKCEMADLQNTFPAANSSFDLAIFQEGIEHLPDQLFALKEFHRILKTDGTLFVTTPNYSNLRSRLSYLLFEAETPKMMPPNELESLWFGKDQRIYMGHIFSIGIMRLRVLAVLAGFEIQKIHPSRINWSSFIIGLIFYPFILIKSFLNYQRSVRKLKIKTDSTQKRMLFSLLKLNLNPTILFGGHLIVEFKRMPTAYQPILDQRHILET